MVCRQCGTGIADKAIICYKCGTATAIPESRPARRTQATRSRIPVWVWATVAAAAASAIWWHFR